MTKTTKYNGIKRIVLMLIMLVAVACTFAGITATHVHAAASGTYSITYDGNGGAGTMAPEPKVVYDADHILPANKFFWIAHKVVGWEDLNSGERFMIDSTGTATIPANTYSVGDAVTLLAIWEENSTDVTLQDGEFEIVLHGGEQAVLPDLPAGTEYQIYEETEDGWTLISQSNTSGTIEPNVTIDAEFTNKYDPASVGANIVAQKYFNGIPASADAFTFDLIVGDASDMTPEQYEAARLQRVQNSAGGLIAFDPITYTDIGNYTYSIVEYIEAEDPSIDYDRHVEIVNVSITRSEEGEMACTINYDADGAKFENNVYPGELKFTKEGVGITPQNKDTEFSFKITFYDDKGIPITEGDLSYYIIASET